MELSDEIYKYSAQIIENITWTSIRKEDAEVKSEKGSFVYVAYNGEQCLYVGETNVSLQARFKKNGNSAHCKKPWYKKVTKVEYCRWELNELQLKERRLLEQAVSIILKPLHYGQVGRPSKK
jgi:hypothetical protein